MSKCWYCNNELTSGDSPKHFGICNKCYDEMFKSSNTIISSFINKIAELQKQLEETEEERDGNYENYSICWKDNEYLKQQLAEKEKIEYTDTINFVETSEPDIVAKELDRLNEQLAESEKQRQHLKDWLDDEILTSVDNESYYATINEYEEEVKKLKQQLEEKDADIIALDTDNYSFKQQIENLRQQLKSQPKEIVEKIRRELGLKLKYKLNDEVSVLKICNQINEVLDTILKDYQK